MLSFNTLGPEATIALGMRIGKALSPGQVVSLNGGLGSGKTYLTKGIAKSLGFEGEVTSPTFTIINVYKGSLPLYHFDCYRLKGPADLQDIGYEEYFYGEGVSVVEWAEKIEGLIPENSVYIDIINRGGDSREIIVKGLIVPVQEKPL